MTPKQRAAEAALQFVQPGMIVGLGSGSTAQHFIEMLGSLLRDGKLADVRGIPTSESSETLARQFGIPLTDFTAVTHCHVTIDGADEIDPSLNLIKGLGGALLREKIVAQNSKQLVIIADTSKKVSQLGTKCPLPVEVLPFAREATERFLRSLGCDPVLRHADGKAYRTDNGNFIYDCRFERISDPISLDRQLKGRAGVVETGLFIQLATAAILAGPDKVQVLQRG
jgi:ribose 5-phosphate isomerase A